MSSDRMLFRALCGAALSLSVGSVGGAQAGAPGEDGRPSAEIASAGGFGCDGRDGQRQGEATCLTVPIDHLKYLKLARGAKTLLIGNPAIADINMIARDQAVVSARSIGSTNVLFLDDSGAVIAEYAVYVREVEASRVVMRRGPTDISHYQCAPRCERSLSQLDSDDPHKHVAGNIGRENAINEAALGDPAAAAAAPAAGGGLTN